MYLGQEYYMSNAVSSQCTIQEAYNGDVNVDLLVKIVTARSRCCDILVFPFEIDNQFVGRYNAFLTMYLLDKNVYAFLNVY